MIQLYQINKFGDSPLSLKPTKQALKVTASADDTVLQNIINAVTQFGENYTGREFRASTWNLLQDDFEEVIQICRDPVDSITSITYLLNGVQIAIPATDYYLVRHQQYSEIELEAGKFWPEVDDRKQSVNIEFVTKSYYLESEILESLTRHTAYLYENRGDCPDTAEAAKLLGITNFYGQFRITRI